MLNFLPDPLYTPEELAAYNAINEVLAVVDAALGITGEHYFLGPVAMLESDTSYFLPVTYDYIQEDELFDTQDWLETTAPKIEYNWFGET